LRDVEGLRGLEAAEVLDISGRALKSRLHRARLRLAAALRAMHDPDLAETEGGPR
jgi:DNA-directed RNA polymerase specialized sigma24 family protein